MKCGREGYNLDVEGIALRFMALLPALTLHEFAHAYSADKLGDPTARHMGRVTLNPLAHLDPIGTLMILFAPIGWARPVPINPHNFRNPAKGMLISSIAGPSSNFVQGMFWGLILRGLVTFAPSVLIRAPLLAGFLYWVTLINFVLALFNLLPLGPLDGHHILAYFLSPGARIKYEQFNQYGFVILMCLIFFQRAIPVLRIFVLVPASLLFALASGLPFPL